VLPLGAAAKIGETGRESGLNDMPEPLMVRERPPQSGVVALLEAEGLPVSDLTESHLEHFFFTGSDGAPSAIVGLELFGPDALLRSLVVSSTARSQGVGSALVLHAEGYAAAHQVRSLYLLTNTAEGYFEHRGYRRIADPHASSRAFARQARPS
jgi:amino-acid N-acetyltransferase